MIEAEVKLREKLKKVHAEKIQAMKDHDMKSYESLHRKEESIKWTLETFF